MLQSAAVIGKDVPFILLHAVADEPEEELRRQLAHLQAAEFLYETRLFPESEYTFKHALTQEVAYGGLLTERRRALHARIVEAIERLHGDRLAEQVERLAHHALRARAVGQGARLRPTGGSQGDGALGAAGCRHPSRAGARRDAGISPRPARPSSRRSTCASTFGTPFTRSARSSGRVALMREAEPLAERLGDEARSGEISLSLGIGLWMMGHSDEAQESGDRALAIAESTDDGLLRHQASGQLARLHHTRGDYRQAVAGFANA